MTDKISSPKIRSNNFKGKRCRDDIIFNIEGTQINLERSVKYLGIQLGEKLNFKVHITETKKKAEAKIAALARLMPNIESPSPEKKKSACRRSQIRCYVWCTDLEPGYEIETK